MQGTLFHLTLSLWQIVKGRYGLHTLLTVHKYPLQSMVLDVGSILGLPANLCTRPVTMAGSVQCLIFRTHQCTGSGSSSEMVAWCLCGVSVVACVHNISFGDKSYVAVTLGR